ncbi:MAG: uroporphyrinogen decarboxylase family protein [Magnetococcales bacterium]|nr:uroporphyrinogen decarboxylase family protein [Magnetococcales bacterium]
MTSLERVLTTISHKEPDRVPLFLLLTMHGAKELGLSIRDYYNRAEYVAEGQLRLLKKYHSDCLYAFFYAAIEVEAWGAEVRFVDDGPPNAGAPLANTAMEIKALKPPEVKGNRILERVLHAQTTMKTHVGNTVPIIGVVMSPFSLPVMQLGFERYLDIMFEEPESMKHLMAINEEFCVDWANAQLAAGATAITYFDPVSSSTIIPPELYLKTGWDIACRTLSRIKGPTATHLASGRALPIVNALAETGTAIIGVSVHEALAALKTACLGKLTILGGLNGIEMRRWSTKEAEEAVKTAIHQAGSGGGFILSDNHGEIPLQVTDEILLTISEAVGRWGRYPLALDDDHSELPGVI